MFSYDSDIELKRAWDYPYPRQSSACLPLVYGDMTIGGTEGLWPAVCIDEYELVYAVAGHAMAGAVRLYGSDGQALPASTYSVRNENYRQKGVICAAHFSEEPSDGQVLVRGKGRVGPSGALLENPVEIVRDILLYTGQDPDVLLCPSTYGRVRSLAESNGFKAAGVIDRQQSLATILTALLGQFLGSWWQSGQGRLKLMLDVGAGSLAEGELCRHIAGRSLRDVEVSASLSDVVNRADVYYCLCPTSGEYLAAFDGRQDHNALSQSLYGQRAQSLELGWVRHQSTAQAISQLIVRKLGVPRRLISCQQSGLENIDLEKGDAALLSLPWLYDENGLGLVNQIVRVLSVEPQMDQRITRFIFMDTGYFKTIAHRADGSLAAGGAYLAGGDRDRRVQ